VSLQDGVLTTFFLRIGSEHVYAMFEPNGALTEWNSFGGTNLTKVIPPAPVLEVPEPETYALMLLGLAAITAVRRRKSAS
jgi:hypothetical protein